MTIESVDVRGLLERVLIHEDRRLNEPEWIERLQWTVVVPLDTDGCRRDGKRGETSVRRQARSCGESIANLFEVGRENVIAFARASFQHRLHGIGRFRKGIVVVVLSLFGCVHPDFRQIDCRPEVVVEQVERVRGQLPFGQFEFIVGQGTVLEEMTDEIRVLTGIVGETFLVRGQGSEKVFDQRDVCETAGAGERRRTCDEALLVVGRTAGDVFVGEINVGTVGNEQLHQGEILLFDRFVQSGSTVVGVNVQIQRAEGRASLRQSRKKIV